MVARFQASEPGSTPIFLLSLKAAGTGLNLSRADHVIHYDRWWNPAVENQATDRAYRIGQHKPVQVHRLITQGTVEERIAQMLGAKRAVADSVLAIRSEAAQLSSTELADLPDGRCTAVEALVRWQHPQRGLLYPEAFIAAAERIGAIGEIGAFVLRQACADSALWRSAHPHSPMAVHINVSERQLDDQSFLDTVTRCLSDFSLPPDQLVLEITESPVIFSPLAIDRLNTLADHGVSIAIDDFGTGYSALTTLRSLRAKIVKIDRSLIAGCSDSPQDRAVIEAVVKMAAQMGMRTIAEGVETLEQQEFVVGINTDAAQGYLYLRPAPAREFGEWLGTNLNSPALTRPVGDVVLPFKPRRTG
jgi:EAL domain-containing protein (putative c-di-GMP-specific phosphodiesterase class I)